LNTDIGTVNLKSEMIEIDIQVLKKHKLSPTDYTALVLLDKGLSKDEIDEVIEGGINWKSMMDKRWIKFDNGVHLCPKYENSFRPDIDKMFMEFYNTFPYKAGSRPLRAASLDSKAAKDTKKRFKREIGKRNASAKFEMLMTGLHAEMKSRRMRGEFKYMNNINTWLNQHVYEKWQPEPEKEENSPGYGQDLK